MAPALRQVFRQRDLPHPFGREPILRRVRGQEFHLRQFPLAPQVRSGAGRRPPGRAARILRRDDSAESRPATHHEKDGHLLLHEHHQRGELGFCRHADGQRQRIRRQQQPAAQHCPAAERRSGKCADNDVHQIKGNGFDDDDDQRHNVHSHHTDQPDANFLPGKHLRRIASSLLIAQL